MTDTDLDRLERSLRRTPGQAGYAAAIVRLRVENQNLAKKYWEAERDLRIAEGARDLVEHALSEHEVACKAYKAENQTLENFVVDAITLLRSHQNKPLVEKFFDQLFAHKETWRYLPVKKEGENV